MKANASLLAEIRTFPQLVKYLRDELDWPIQSEDFDDMTFDYTPEELGIDSKSAAKIEEIKRLRPLSVNQPWGVFFVKFERKTLPVVALRRILSSVVLKKRASANASDRAAWAAEDLLFISNFGQGEERQISFAHFSQDPSKQDLPTLKVLGWDNLDTVLRLDQVTETLEAHLAWPEDEGNAEAWREQWRSAFTLRHREVITTAKELAVRLAELAKAIRNRILMALAIETESGPLTSLMKAFQEALIHDLEGDKFADMYAQTIAYGLLSARVANPTANTADDLATQMPVTNPFLKELMETFLQVGGRKGKGKGAIDFDELGVSEVVELLDNSKMEEVVLDFGNRNPLEDPVIHFYEYFLAAYDKKQKVDRGVFYTPRPVVSYIVRSVDDLLRTEFGLDDGLADTTTWSEMERRHKGLRIPEGVPPEQGFVQILDPACGTGTFLVEVIELIHKRMVAKWETQGHTELEIAALWNDYVPVHLLTRLHGYELLMAPYAIAHLKIGLKLYETGYQFGTDERARIYLTNSLESALDFTGQFESMIPALAHEAQAVNEVKRHRRFTVIIGNPPYLGEAGRGGDWIAGLLRGIDVQTGQTTQNYFQIEGKALKERTTKWINDDYVKFIRFSEWTVEKTGVGVVGLVTNHSYLDNPTFRGVRESLLNSFQTISVVDLHGNANKKESAPDGLPDANVFDILQGVSIALMSRRNGEASGMSEVRHAELWGKREHKYTALASVSTTSIGNALSPSPPLYLLVPENSQLRAEYQAGWSVAEIFPLNGVGMTTARDHMVVDFDPGPLLARAQLFRDSSASNADLCASLAIPEKKGWNVTRARKLLKAENELVQFIRPILYRPLDVRLIFYHDSLVWRTVKHVMRHMRDGQNLALVTTRQTKDLWGATVTRHMIGHKTCGAYDINSLFPLYVYTESSGSLLSDSGNGWQADDTGRQPNLSVRFVKAIEERLNLSFVSHNPIGENAFGPEEIFHYLYALFHSPGYRSRYVEFLKSDFARVLLPGSRRLFRSLSALGSNLVLLQLLESPELKQPITTFIGPRNTKVGRVTWSNNTVWLDSAATGKGKLSGGTTGFLGVPQAVWNFHIGGYQVCDKWLKDRKGRQLSSDDIDHYRKIIVAISETIRLMGEIDEVIDSSGGWPDAFAINEVA